VGLKARKRGPKAKAVDPRVKQLERENVRLKRRLEEAETIIDFQKKLSKLLGIPLKPHDSDEND
jgi:cell shape-determining protein MreC